MRTISIQLSDEAATALEALARRTGRDREELVTSLVERELELTQHGYVLGLGATDLAEIRRTLEPYARAAGSPSEEEILDDIS